MNESKKVVTKLDAGVASPISISKSQAYDIANQQTKINNEIKEQQEKKENPNNIVEPQKVEEIDLEKINQVNDFIKTQKKQTSLFTYLILILILIVLVVIFVVFELPILRGL